MRDDNVRLSKVLAHALRHAPRQYELDVDTEGWVRLQALLDALRRRPEWRNLQRADIEAMMAASNKQRFQLKDDHIRALYGHSLTGKLSKEPAVPPPVLFHGTSPQAAAIILREGLKPMRRQYVHLSEDVETALQVGRRKAARPVILEIDTPAARASGVAFYRGNKQVWLADAVPPAHIGCSGL